MVQGMSEDKDLKKTVRRVKTVFHIVYHTLEVCSTIQLPFPSLL